MRRGLIAIHVAVLMLINAGIGLSEGFFFPEGGSMLGAPVSLWSAAATMVVGASVFFSLSLKAGADRLRHALTAALLYFAIAILLALVFRSLLWPLPIDGLLLDSALEIFGFSIGTVLAGVATRRPVAASSDA